MDYNCIFDPAKNQIIDVIPADSDGSAWFAKHGDAYGTGLVVLPAREAQRRYEDGFKSEPVSITPEQWEQALGCLPPVAWKRDGSGESFKMSERMAGCVTGIYVRIGERHFQFYDDIRLPHHECLARCVLSKANLVSA